MKNVTKILLSEDIPEEAKTILEEMAGLILRLVTKPKPIHSVFAVTEPPPPLFEEEAPKERKIRKVNRVSKKTPITDARIAEMLKKFLGTHSKTGAKLKEIRDSHKLPGRAVAEAIGRGSNGLSYWENNFEEKPIPPEAVEAMRAFVKKHLKNSDAAGEEVR